MFLTPLDFLGDRQSFLKQRGIGFLGFGQEFLDFQIRLEELVFSVTVTHSGVLAGFGQNLGTVDVQRGLDDFEDSATGGYFQNLREGLLEKRSVFSE